MTAFRLPDIGEGLAEAEVVRWLVDEGGTMTRDEPVVEILTDKATVELPAPESGTMATHAAAVGDVVEVGDTLFEYESSSAAAPPEKPEPIAPRKAAASLRASPPVSAGRRPKAAPATRKLARDLGVDLHGVTGTGPGGRITAADVQQAGAAPSAHAAPTASGSPAALGQMPTGVHPLRGIRRATARAMAQSWSTIPHIHMLDEVDASHLVELRTRLTDAGHMLTPPAFFVAAAARALSRFPLVNASIDTVRDEITVHASVNIGLAVATDNGLMVPVIEDADTLDLFGLAAEIGRLTEAARTGVLTPGDLAGGTFTISNYGSIGGRHALPIIRPPEAGILGVGAISSRPLVVDDEVVARPTLPLVLGADHRLIDGDVAVAFMGSIAATLADPLVLLLPSAEPR